MTSDTFLRRIITDDTPQSTAQFRAQVRRQKEMLRNDFQLARNVSIGQNFKAHQLLGSSNPESTKGLVMPTNVAMQTVDNYYSQYYSFVLNNHTRQQINKNYTLAPFHSKIQSIRHSTEQSNTKKTLLFTPGVGTLRHIHIFIHIMNGHTTAHSYNSYFRTSKIVI